MSPLAAAEQVQVSRALLPARLGDRSQCLPALFGALPCRSGNRRRGLEGDEEGKLPGGDPGRQRVMDEERAHEPSAQTGCCGAGALVSGRTT